MFHSEKGGWRFFEGLFRKALDVVPKISTTEKGELLSTAHDGDCMLADLETALRRPITMDLLDNLEAWIKDPEHQREHNRLFREEVERLGRGLNGYESLALWQRAHEIIENREA